jgi:S1-C subfamily serine protease
MKNFLLIFLLPLFFIGSEVRAQKYEAEQIYSMYNDAVVVVIACDRYGSPVSQGSGVVIDDYGTIVTNYHVCGGYTNIKIKHNETIIDDVEITGGSKSSDVIFLKISSGIFKSIPLGSSSDVKIGQKVFALGSPLGFENSITEGIVNGIRKISSYSDDNYIQISASISHGSSGGALISSEGVLMGITTSTIEEGQNINFAIPVDKIISIQNSSYSNKTDDIYTSPNSKKDSDYTTKSGDPRKETKSKTTTKAKSGKDNDEGESRARVPGVDEDNSYDSRRDRNSYTDYIYNGNSAFEREDYSTAIDYYRSYLKYYPEDYGVIYSVGLCYYMMDNDRAAKNEFMKVYSYGVKDARLYSALGDVERRLGNYDASIEYFTMSIRLDARREDSYSGMGLTYFYMGNYGESAICFTACILLDNSYGWYYYMRGKCYLMGDLSSAVLDPCADFRKAYSLGHTESAEYYNQYCR